MPSAGGVARGRKQVYSIFWDKLLAAALQYEAAAPVSLGGSSWSAAALIRIYLICAGAIPGLSCTVQSIDIKAFNPDNVKAPQTILQHGAQRITGSRRDASGPQPFIFFSVFKWCAGCTRPAEVHCSFHALPLLIV